VGFVYQQECYACSIEAGSEPIQLTHGARGTQVTHGVADFCAQEEMDRYEGYWISPDGQHLAFEARFHPLFQPVSPISPRFSTIQQAVDESHIPEFRIMHSGKDTVGVEASEDHHYPFAGEANPRFKLGVVRTDGKGEVCQPKACLVSIVDAVGERQRFSLSLCGRVRRFERLALISFFRWF